MLKINDLYFDYNQSFDNFELNGEGYIVINVTFSLGNNFNESLFNFDLSNDIDLETDHKLLDNFDFFFREKGLFTFSKFNKFDLKDFLVKFIEFETSKCSEDQECLLKISKYFNWEFDSYRDVN